MLIQATVGPQSAQSVQPGTLAALRLGQLNDLVVSELHGKYYEGAYRKNRYTAANQAGQVTTVGLATTYTGLCVYNPVGTSVNGILELAGFSSVVTPAASMAIGIMTGYAATGGVTTVTTAVTPSNNFGGAAAGQLKAISSGVITTPVLQTILGAVAITTTYSEPGLFDLGGAIILPPGAFAAFYTSTASGAAGMFFSMQWEEVPV